MSDAWMQRGMRGHTHCTLLLSTVAVALGGGSVIANLLSPGLSPMGAPAAIVSGCCAVLFGGAVFVATGEMAEWAARLRALKADFRKAANALR